MHKKHLFSALSLGLGALAAGLLVSPSLAQQTAPVVEADWSGNFAIDPGFEEDFINNNAEPHVLSFKGDWFYNQKDLTPDFWKLTGAWKWNTTTPHAGGHSLVLPEKATAVQDYKGALYQEGGGSWGGAPTFPIIMANPERMAQPWRATVWCRGGGTIQLGPATAKASGGAQWEQVTVELPAAQVPKDNAIIVALTGPGEFDDLVVQEHLANSPNLLPNAGFEQVDKNNYPAGWTQQRKFDWIGPTYYVWTDWNHYHEENRGPVTTDPLVFHSGQRSLRFDVYPGDEKFIQSDPITVNQTAANLIEVSAYVRADRIKLFDIRCIDEDGTNLPCYYPVQPEYSNGGTETFGNGTFGWRYVRKFFASPFKEPIKNVRVRLAARGFNAHTLDDSGTRAYACQTGTVWWDDVRVTERTSTADELKARGVTIRAQAQAGITPFTDAAVDFGDRLYGDNIMSISLANIDGSGSYKARLTTSLPGQKPVITQSGTLNLKKGAQGALTVPYRIDKLVGDFRSQGTFRLELLRNNKVATDTTYAFNTWPVVVDFDISRHYNLPEENPVTVSLNLGVGSGTLSKVKSLELDMQRVSDHASVGKQVITDIPAAFAGSLAAIPTDKTKSYEFNLPTPNFWADRTNLILTRLDLSKLKVWPHDNPVRDTVLVVRGLDAGGKVLFTDTSDGFCRMQQTPKQPAIQSVSIRDDGAVLINGQPRLLTGATHQQQRLNHSPEIIEQLGLMGHRLLPGKYEDTRKLWTKNGLYNLQFKPIDGAGSTDVIVEMKPEQQKALQDFIAAGGLESVVSINTGGWESHVPLDAPTVAKHKEINDWLRQQTKRPIAWSSSGAFNAWNMPQFTFYDIVHAETEMWGPMDFDTIFLPYMKRARPTPTAWVYLPQLYENTPYERYRFETYENIIRGSAGVEMIQGIGDATFNRGLAGELRYLEGPLYSQEPAPAVTLEPNVSHITRRKNNKTYVLATNSGPIVMGNWKWNTTTKQSGTASHEGDSVNRMWMRPGGLRLHGFRGLSHPELVQAGDKIVQYVWIDPNEKPDWAMVAVRGDGRFSHCGVLGNFDFNKWRGQQGNIFMFSELEHSVWHEISWIMDDELYQKALKLMPKESADFYKKYADIGRAEVDKSIYQAEHFHKVGDLPAGGQWVRIEMTAEQLGLVGSLVDGFAYMTQNGRALWDYSALERNGKVVRVFCDDSVGIDRGQLDSVRVNVPGLKAGTKVHALFEDRDIVAGDGFFTDNFQGVDTYGDEAGAVIGDMFGYVKDDNRDLPRMMPSGYGYTYGPTAVHIYEIEQ